MYQVNNAIVRDGKIVLSRLPFQDGQHVRIVVTEAESGGKSQRRSIAEVRQALKGAVTRFEDPFEAMIPTDAWETLK